MRAGSWTVAVLLVTACQPQSERNAEWPMQEVSPSVSVTAAQAPRPASKAILSAAGVIFDVPAGKTEEFVLGASRTDVDAAAERTFGSPDERTELAECGAGPMEFSRYGPLTLNFQDGKLVGWFAREGTQVVTSDGIRPGARFRDLKVARSARMIAGSTLEGEFDYLAADGQPIRGFVKGEGRDAKIDSLYAGVNCFFR